MIAIRAEHRRFALWAAGVLIVALPLWWLWGADLVAAMLRPVAMLLFKATGLSGDVVAMADGWRVDTGLPLANGQGDFVYPLSRDTIRRMLLGFPLLVAFLSAPPRSDRLVRAAVIGVAALSLVFVVSLTGFLWGELAPILNPALAPAGAQRAVVLAAEPLHPFLAQTALLCRYAGMSVLPLLTAVLVWAGTNPKAVKSFAR